MSKTFVQLREDVAELGLRLPINKELRGEVVDCVAMVRKKKLNSLHMSVKLSIRELTLYSLLKTISAFMCCIALIILAIYIDSLILVGLGGVGIVVCVCLLCKIIVRFVYFGIPESHSLLNKSEWVSDGIKSLYAMQKMLSKEIIRRNRYSKISEN